jgi:hypothetical protein
MSQNKSNVKCKSCGGPVKDYPDKKVVNPDFCPYCVDEQGELLGYKEILDSMISYIKSDHPDIKKEKRVDKANEWLREGPIWGEKFSGVIIQESLKNKRILRFVRILKKELADGLDPELHGGFSTWNLLHVEFFRTELDKIIEILQLDLAAKDWYADFRGNKEHYIVFKGKSFKCEIGNKDSYEKAVEYGLEMEIPKKQLDFVG